MLGYMNNFRERTQGGINSLKKNKKKTLIPGLHWMRAHCGTSAPCFTVRLRLWSTQRLHLTVVVTALKEFAPHHMM